MLLGVYLKNKALSADPGFLKMKSKLEGAGAVMYEIDSNDNLQDGTDAVLSVGGDGTFLSASQLVADSGVPILGVNLGRLGFLSENRPQDVANALLDGGYELENRTMLSVSASGGELRPDGEYWPFALNEIAVHRDGAAMLGVKVTLDGNALPAYWADGLLVVTSSGSTAYSLSVGGPICTPDSKVLIIAPIAPHNLNVRPLVVPETSRIGISIISRDESAVLTMDNRTMRIDGSVELHVSMAQFSLKRIRLRNSNFVKALMSKLFWGEDIRNYSD